MASIASEIGVAPGARPELDRVHRGCVPARERRQGGERHTLAHVVGQREHLEAAIGEANEDVFPVPPPEEEFDAARQG